MRQPRKRLSEILSEGQKKNIFQSWDQVQAAEDFTVLPAGNYLTRIADAYAAEAGTGTPSYKLVFQVIEGEHAGRRIWHDLWLTEAALPGLKRDCLKLGITDPQRQLDEPSTPAKLRRVRCQVTLIVKRDNDGNPFNKVRGFEVVGIDPPEEEPFAPPPSAETSRTDRLDPDRSEGGRDPLPSANGEEVAP
jgi:hypothetical protein